MADIGVAPSLVSPAHTAITGVAQVQRGGDDVATVSAGLAGVTAVMQHDDAPDLTGITHVSRFTTWGNGLSLGRLVGGIIALPGRLIAAVGGLCADADITPLRYLGKLIRFIGNVIEFAGGLTGQIVTLIEKAVITSFKTAGGVCLFLFDLARAAVSCFCGAPHLDLRGLRCIRDALMAAGETQQNALDRDDAWRADAARKGRECVESLRAVTGNNANWIPNDVLESLSPPDSNVFQDHILRHIPEKWHARCRVPAQKTDFALVEGLSVTTVVRWERDNSVSISFFGARHVRSLVCTGFLSALGYADDTFTQARELVRDIARENGGRTQVAGYCLGGALAQYAGVAADVPVTCFNSVGLSSRLADELIDFEDIVSGRARTKTMRVTHINAEHDWVAHYLQTRYLPLALTQAGERYKVPGIDLEHLFLPLLDRLSPPQEAPSGGGGA